MREGREIYGGKEREREREREKLRNQCLIEKCFLTVGKAYLKNQQVLSETVPVHSEVLIINWVYSCGHEGRYPQKNQKSTSPQCC